MAHIALIYSTVDGHTLEICERLQQVIEQDGHDSKLLELTADSNPDLSVYDRIVIGASIRYGKHRPEVTRLINNNVELLDSKSSAFFSVNSVARKPEKRQPDTNPYVKKFLRKIRWNPPLIAIFGGKIEYRRYDWFDRTMIRFIMWMTKGPTDLDGSYDFTDWDEVEAFGRAIAA